MRSVWLLTPAALAASTSGYATTYLTVAQAQAALFPGATLTSVAMVLTPDQRAAIERASGRRAPAAKLQGWKTAQGEWFLVDNVIGKHEFITYAVGLNADGAVRGVEILDYRESYGGEVRYEKWCAQFRGRRATSPLKLGQDIQNISGATLSCRHVTEGVKRLLATYELVLKTAK
jgi:hypothetical protein